MLVVFFMKSTCKFIAKGDTGSTAGIAFVLHSDDLFDSDLCSSACSAGLASKFQLTRMLVYLLQFCLSIRGDRD
jgi:hypothetical protein